jgi:hypothetical protein
MRKELVAILLALCTSCGSNAPPPAVSAPGLGPPAALNPRIIDELREKCGQDARDWFSHINDRENNFKGSYVTQDYTNHYNERLKRCYLVLISTAVKQDSKPKTRTISIEGHLVDVGENKGVGTFIEYSDAGGPAECLVANHNCKSMKEWEDLVAPYMEP